MAGSPYNKVFRRVPPISETLMWTVKIQTAVVADSSFLEDIASLDGPAEVTTCET